MASNVVTPKLKQLSLCTAKYYTLTSLLERYTKARSLSAIEKLHAHIITSGLLSLHSVNPISLLSNLASSYALCGRVHYARNLFDELPQPKLFLYNAIIRMYSQHGSPCQVLRLFGRMLCCSGRFGYGLYPDNFTYPFVIKACGDMSLLENGVVVHGKVVTSGFGSNIYVVNSLLAMYMNCGDVEMARRVFYGMGDKDMVSWGTTINGFVVNERLSDALAVFDGMVNTGVEVTRCSLLPLLSACRKLKNLALGRKLHAVVVEKGLQDDMSVGNALIDMYAKCGSMSEAQGAFDEVNVKDVVTWTTLINGYVINSNARTALGLCWRMQTEGVMPNCVTIALLLQACAKLCALTQGTCLHACVIRRHRLCDIVIETALIDMYAKCNRIDLSLQVFTESSQRRLAPSNAMISGYMFNGLACEALLFFKEMLHEEITPDVVTFGGVLPAYADLANLQQACNIHSYLIRSGSLSKNEIVVALVDVYSKCGDLGSSCNIFNEVSPKGRDIAIWSSLIAGYGAHGNGEVAVVLFKHMVLSGVQPNEVTFTSVLDACSHSGLVDEGLDLFKLMLEGGQTIPSMYHYTCMLDLLGRAGRLREAYELIITMPFQPNHAVWGALLGASMVHENVGLGEIAAKSLISLEPENTGNYVMLANVYASAERWEDAATTRSMISAIKSGKTPAHSLVVS